MLLMVADNLINFNTCHGKLLLCNFHIQKEIFKNKLLYFNSSAHGIGGWVPFRGHKSHGQGNTPTPGFNQICQSEKSAFAKHGYSDPRKPSRLIVANKSDFRLREVPF